MKRGSGGEEENKKMKENEGEGGEGTAAAAFVLGLLNLHYLDPVRESPAPSLLPPFFHCLLPPAFAFAFFSQSPIWFLTTTTTTGTAAFLQESIRRTLAAHWSNFLPARAVHGGANGANGGELLVKSTPVQPPPQPSPPALEIRRESPGTRKKTLEKLFFKLEFINSYRHFASSH